MCLMLKNISMNNNIYLLQTHMSTIHWDLEHKPQHLDMPKKINLVTRVKFHENIYGIILSVTSAQIK
jgi:hypothetical protein